MTNSTYDLQKLHIFDNQLGPLLPMWIAFNYSVDNYSYTQKWVISFTLYSECYYLPMPILKIIHLSKRGPDGCKVQFAL